MWELTVIGRFAAAHSLRNFKGRCEALHGHNWKVEAAVKGSTLNEAALVMDFGELKALMNQVLDTLDHCHLNECPPFDQLNPSSEMIAKYIWDKMAAGLPPEVSMSRVSAWESEDSRATYLGPEAS